MKCPICAKSNQKSTVEENDMDVVSSEYCPPFLDADGNEHIHNNNNSTFGYLCSLGHAFSVKKDNTCWCGWPKTS